MKVPLTRESARGRLELLRDELSAVMAEAPTNSGPKLRQKLLRAAKITAAIAECRAIIGPPQFIGHDTTIREST